MNYRKQISRLAALSLLTIISLASAQTQTFSFTIPAVDVIAASGAASIDLAAPAAGEVIAMGSSSATTLSFSSNNTGLRNITATLDAAMPTGTQLVLKPVAGSRTTDNLGFTGGTVPQLVSSVTLSTTAARLVTTTGGGFQQVAYKGVGLTYELTASLQAAPQTTTASRTITFSIIAN